MKTIAIAAGLLCMLAPAGVFAADSKPAVFEPGEKAIIMKIVDKNIADIAALKGKYPELAHFGEAPYFTRGETEFRYDYKTEVDKDDDSNKEMAEMFPGTVVTPLRKALPGGCGMHFSMIHTGSGGSVLPPDGFPWQSSSSDYFGVTSIFSITVDAKRDAVKQAIMAILDRNRALQNNLLSQYRLTKNGTKLGTPFLLQALQDPDQKVYRSAMQLLTPRTLSAKELATLKEGFMQGKYPLEVAFEGLNIIRKQDDSHLPGFERDLAEMTIKSETAPTDLSTADHYGFSNHLYNARRVRQEDIMAYLRGNKEERFIPVATLILNTDTVVENQLSALDYFNGLPVEKRRPAFIAALGCSRRSVQAHAAELIGAGHITGMEEPLKSLLLSPSSKVRLAATAALQKLGVKPPDALPPRTLPESAARISDTLQACGLTDDEILADCSRPKLKVSDPLREKPDAAQLPAQVTLTDDKTTTNTAPDGTVISTLHYHLELNDPWRMSKVDADSVKKRGMQYAFGFGNDWGPDPGPLLFAAAMKLKDTETALAVYEKMRDDYEDDDAILSSAIQGLAWNRYCAGLKAFAMANDNAAQELFSKVVGLEKYRGLPIQRVTDFLGEYIQQSRELLADIAHRRAAEPPPAPIFPGAKESISYWSQQVPNKAARIKALIVELDNVGTRNAAGRGTTQAQEDPLFAALVNEGDDAVPPLIDCLEHDTRLTRMVESDMDHGEMPVRWASPVRYTAYAALCAILKKDFVDSQNYAGFGRGDPDTLAAMAADMRKYMETRNSNPAAKP